MDLESKALKALHYLCRVKALHYLCRVKALHYLCRVKALHYLCRVKALHYLCRVKALHYLCREKKGAAQLCAALFLNMRKAGFLMTRLKIRSWIFYQKG